jgi:K+-transporting ATPase ATPase C chain
MKTIFASLHRASIALLSLTLILGLFYPLFMVGIAQIFFHSKANGSLLFHKNGEILGSREIAQGFSSPNYFHPRPSSAGKGYDASNSSGSNLGPTSQKLFDALAQRASAYRSENALSTDTPIPADAVTASGSGLDPHISLQNAYSQASRVAAARNRPVDEIHTLIEAHKKGGMFGEPRVNVLLLNLALDKGTP